MYPVGETRMVNDYAFDQLWNAPAEQAALFRPEQVAALPTAVRQYFKHTIALGTPSASAVRLHMHGAIRLKSTWYSFDADQVIRRERGFVWHARVKMKGLPVTGFDR